MGKSSSGNGGSNKQPPDVNYRSASTGRYVKESYAKTHPAYDGEGTRPQEVRIAFEKVIIFKGRCASALFCETGTRHMCAGARVQTDAARAWGLP